MGTPVSERTHKKSVENARLRGERKPRATHDRREDRRDRAAERYADRQARTDEEQLALLIERGYPQCREAERLRKKIRDTPAPVEETTTEE